MMANISLPRGILISTMQKSGSVFLLNSLMCNYKTRNMRTTSGGFPYSNLSYQLMENLCENKYISQEHIEPSVININIINAFLDKFWLHFRDPRSCLDSWVAHCQRIGERKISNMPIEYLEFDPMPPCDYPKWELPDQRAWMITHHYPHFIAWLKNWHDAITQNRIKPKIFISEYSQLHGNEAEFLKQAIDFYNLPMPDEIILAEKNMTQAHYRSGKKTSWKNWDRADIERTSALIPKDIAKKYGWEL